MCRWPVKCILYPGMPSHHGDCCCSYGKPWSGVGLPNFTYWSINTQYFLSLISAYMSVGCCAMYNDKEPCQFHPAKISAQCLFHLTLQSCLTLFILLKKANIILSSKHSACVSLSITVHLEWVLLGEHIEFDDVILAKEATLPHYGVSEVFFEVKQLN